MILKLPIPSISRCGLHFAPLFHYKRRRFKFEPRARKTRNMSSQSPLFKVQVCLYKKDDTSYDEFIQWATEVYPVKAIPLMKSYGMVKWTTVGIPQSQF